MSEIPEYPENPKTPEESTKGDNASGGELSREQMQDKIKRMSIKIASLKKKSGKSKRAQDITPTKLNFDAAEKRAETPSRRPIQEKTIYKERSPAANMSVFDRLGKKPTEQDLRHWLDNKATTRTSQKYRNPRLPLDKGRRSPHLKLSPRIRIAGLQQ